MTLSTQITERIVKSRLNENLSPNSLYNPNQSAYIKHHSTETNLSHFLWHTQGSVFGPIIFNMYTTPLSLILYRPLNHYLYADDTKIFISFAPTIFITAISQLQDTIAHISFWMTSNLLSLNSSKTEFIQKIPNGPNG